MKFTFILLLVVIFFKSFLAAPFDEGQYGLTENKNNFIQNLLGHNGWGNRWNEHRDPSYQMNRQPPPKDNKNDKTGNGYLQHG